MPAKAGHISLRITALEFVLCCVALSFWSLIFVESAVKCVDTSLHVYQTMTPGLHNALFLDGFPLYTL